MKFTKNFLKDINYSISNIDIKSITKSIQILHKLKKIKVDYLSLVSGVVLVMHRMQLTILENYVI